jgi:hypothetical protein
VAACHNDVTATARGRTRGNSNVATAGTTAAADTNRDVACSGTVTSGHDNATRRRCSGRARSQAHTTRRSGTSTITTADVNSATNARTSARLHANSTAATVDTNALARRHDDVTAGSTCASRQLKRSTLTSSRVGAARDHTDDTTVAAVAVAARHSDCTACTALCSTGSNGHGPASSSLA